MRTGLVALALTAACGGAPAPASSPGPSSPTPETSGPTPVAAPTPTTAAPVASSTPDPAPAPTTTRSIAGYPDPVEPQPITCRLSGEWEHDQPRALRFRAGGKVVLTVGKTKRAELSLTDTGKTAFVELFTDVVRVWGFVPGESLVLHAAKPFVVAGYAVPGASASLRLLGASQEAVSFEVKLPKTIDAIVPAQGERPCGDLSLESRTEFHAEEAIGLEGGSDAMLADRRSIPLSTEAGGAPVAKLRYETGDGPIVDVIERRGQHAHVIVRVHSLDPLANVVVFGWVPEKVLRPHTGGFGGSWATGGGLGTKRQPRKADSRVVKCEDELPLVAELDGERHLVGALAPGVELDVLAAGAASEGDELVEVVATTAPIELADGARLLAKGSALAQCAAVAR